MVQVPMITSDTSAPKDAHRKHFRGQRVSPELRSSFWQAERARERKKTQKQKIDREWERKRERERERESEQDKTEYLEPPGK